jgi:hypothetical protein
MAQPRSRDDQVKALAEILDNRLTRHSDQITSGQTRDMMITRFTNDLALPIDQNKRQEAKQLLTATTPSPTTTPTPATPPTTGSCTYVSGRDTFCINNVTLDECNILGGDFRPAGDCGSTPSWTGI